MTALLRRLASTTSPTSSSSTAGGFHFNGRPQNVPCPGKMMEAQAGFGAPRFLQLETMFIDMQVKGFISHTRIFYKFRSTEDSWTAEASYSFRLPNEAAVMPFKLEVGDDHAIEDESRPLKRARKLYNKAVRSETPAAILREVEPGIFEANLGRIPPGVQVTMVLRIAERIPSNVRGELMIKYPALSPSAWSSYPEDTNVSLDIEIVQEDLIHTISSPTHQKLLSIKAGVIGAAREANPFASQHNFEKSSFERPNQATVSLSANHRALQKDFELVIKTSNETQRTVASLSATNRFGHAVLVVTIRPCDLFNGEQDTEWSIDIELDHPWTCCSSDLREMNFTRVPHHDASSSPSKFQYIRSPKILPKISHRQSYSVFFLLDFRDANEYFLDLVCITAISSGGIHAAITQKVKLDVVRTRTVDSTLQKLCASSILRDVYSTLMSHKHHNLYTEGRSLGSWSLVTSAEHLGQMYSVCNHWTSKIVADSIYDSDDDTDFKGPRLYEDELSRLALPTHGAYAVEPLFSIRSPATFPELLPNVRHGLPASAVRSTLVGENDFVVQSQSHEAEDEEPKKNVGVFTSPKSALRPHRPSERSSKDRKGKRVSSTSQLLKRNRSSPKPINNLSVGSSIPPEERLQDQPNSIDIPASLPEAGPFNFNTLPQEIHLDTMDAMDYSDYSPIDNAVPITDPGLDSSSITFQDASTTDYQWDDIYRANQAQLPAPTFNKELAIQFAAFSEAELYKTHITPHISPIGQGNATLHTPHSLADVDESFDNIPVGINGGGADLLPFTPTTEAKPITYEPPLFSNEIPSVAAGYSQPNSQEFWAFNWSANTNGSIEYRRGRHRCISASCDTDKKDIPERESTRIGGNPPPHTECQSGEIWAQIEASRSVSGTYTLHVDLRYRIESRFSSGTRQWLVERIAPSFRRGDNRDLEVVANTMLVLAFVKVCIIDHYEEAEKHVGLILNREQRQKAILEELVLRAVRDNDGDDGEALFTAVDRKYDAGQVLGA